MTIGLGRTARLLLALLLVVAPSVALIDPADLPVLGVSDGSDSGASDDVTPRDHIPLGAAAPQQLDARPVLVSAPYPAGGHAIPSDPAHRPASSRSPPSR